MTFPNYSPRPGSKADAAIQLLANEGPQSRARIASHIDAPSNSVDGILDAAVRAGVVVKVAGTSGRTFWSLADDTWRVTESANDDADQAQVDDDEIEVDDQGEIDDQGEPQPAHFACSIWSDGELQLVRDGEVFTLSAQHTAELIAYLKPFAAGSAA